jgi:hypothetical protein
VTVDDFAIHNRLGSSTDVDWVLMTAQGYQESAEYGFTDIDGARPDIWRFRFPDRPIPLAKSPTVSGAGRHSSAPSS